MATERGKRMRHDAGADADMIRIDALWLSVQPLDMRSGIDSVLARVVGVFGSAKPRTAYVFSNRRANRLKVLVHDGVGIWLAARRLHKGKFVWPQDDGGQTRGLSRVQLDALVVGLPWQRIEGAIDLL